MTTTQDKINALEEERQALYNLGNGLEVDTEKRRTRLGEIKEKLDSLWADERAGRAARHGAIDHAWAGQR